MQACKLLVSSISLPFLFIAFVASKLHWNTPFQLLQAVYEQRMHDLEVRTSKIIVFAIAGKCFF
uniref:Uncharacterized protein n=1 Tax=Setaria italica TaxID=4555 RepID=K3YXH4_SETIT